MYVIIYSLSLFPLYFVAVCFYWYTNFPKSAKRRNFWQYFEFPAFPLGIFLCILKIVSKNTWMETHLLWRSPCFWSVVVSSSSQWLTISLTSPFVSKEIIINPTLTSPFLSLGQDIASWPTILWEEISCASENKPFMFMTIHELSSSNSHRIKHPTLHTRFSIIWYSKPKNG